MPAPYNPPWGRGSSGRRASQANPTMRVSHAERTEVADRLSKHYGDGRLDEEEFNERLDRAMKAKTQSDLDGLFDDLPEPETPRSVTRPNPQPRPRGPRPLPRVAFLALVAVLAIMVGQWLARPFIFPFAGFWPLGFHIPWLLIGIAVFVWWRFFRWPRH
jgi:hypothetical protein